LGHARHHLAGQVPSRRVLWVEEKGTLETGQREFEAALFEGRAGGREGGREGLVHREYESESRQPYSNIARGKRQEILKKLGGT
jgi:hypothetical protein